MGIFDTLFTKQFSSGDKLVEKQHTKKTVPIIEPKKSSSLFSALNNLNVPIYTKTSTPAIVEPVKPKQVFQVGEGLNAKEKEKATSTITSQIQKQLADTGGETFEPSLKQFAERTAVGAADILSEAVDFGANFLLTHTPFLIGNQYATSLTPKVQTEIKDKWKDVLNKLELNNNLPTKYVKEAIDKVEQSDFMKNRKAWEEASITDKLVKYPIETVYNIAPSVLSSIGVYAFLGVPAGFAVTAGSTANEVKNSALEYGVSENDAEKLGLTTGLIVGALDSLIPDEVLNRQSKKDFSKSFVKKLVEVGLTGTKEAGTEVAQEDIQLLAESSFRDDLGWDEIKTRNVLSGLGGFLGGTGLQMSTNFVNSVKEGNYKNIPMGLSLETDLTFANKKVNQENAVQFKTDAFLGKLEDKRASVNDNVFNKLVSNNVIKADATPDTTVPVYRATKPKDTLDVNVQPGDFITTNKKLAENYIKKRPGSILKEAEVTVKDLIDYGGTSHEFIYLPESDVVKMSTDEKVGLPAETGLKAVGLGTVQQKITKTESSLLKQKLKNMSSAARTANVMTKREVMGVQREILSEIENSELSKKDQQKFTKLIIKTQTNQQLARVMDELSNRISRIENNSLKTGLRNKIKESLKSLELSIRGKNKSNTKYDAIAEDILATIKSAINMSEDEAQAVIAETLQKAQSENRSLTFDEKERNRVLGEYSGLKDLSAVELEQLLDEINVAVEDGYVRRMMTLEEKNNVKKLDIDNAIKTLTAGKGLTPTEQRFSLEDKKKNWRMGWSGRAVAVGMNQTDFEGIGNMISTFSPDLKTKDFFKRLNYDLAQRNAEMYGIKEQTNKMRDIFSEVYGIHNDPDMILKQAEMNNDIVYVKEFKDGVTGQMVKYELTKGELMYYYTLMQNKNTEKTLKLNNGFSNDLLEDIKSTIEKNPEDIAFIENIQQYFSDYYDKINTVFRDEYGKNLPKAEKYIPIRRDLVGIKNEDLGYGDFFNVLDEMASLSPTAFQERFKNTTYKIKQSSILDVTTRYTSDIEHWLAWNKLINRWRNVYYNPTINKLIERTFGNQMNKVIDRFIENTTRGSIFMYESTDAFMWLKRNFTRSKIIAKPLIGLKQMTSQIAYLERIGLTDYIKYSVDFLMNPIKSVRFLKENSIWFENRAGNIDKDIIQMTKDPKYKNAIKKKGFFDILALNVILGDQAAIAWGGHTLYKSVYNQKINEGKSKENAHKIAIREFEKFSTKTQQSAFVTDLSYYQQSGSPLIQLFTVFKSAPNQYFRKELMVLRKLFSTVVIEKRAPTFAEMKKLSKTFVLYHFVLPAFFQWVSDGFTWDKDEQKRAAITGSLNGVLLWGDGVEYLIRKMLQIQTFESNNLIESTFKDFGDLMNLKDFDFQDFTWDEMWEAIYTMAKPADILTGLPTKYGADVVHSIFDVMDSEYVKAGGRFIGYSEYALDKRDGMNSLIEKAKTQKVDEEKVKTEINLRVDNNQITLEMADKAWEQYLKNQDKYYADLEVKTLDDMSSDEQKQKYFETLPDDIQDNVKKVYSKKDKEKANRIELKYNNGEISKEEADARWEEYTSNNWMPR